MTKKQTHYYVFNDKRYDNMKDLVTNMGNGISSRALKHYLRNGIVKKIDLV